MIHLDLFPKSANSNKNASPLRYMGVGVQNVNLRSTFNFSRVHDVVNVVTSWCDLSRSLGSQLVSNGHIKRCISGRGSIDSEWCGLSGANTLGVQTRTEAAHVLWIDLIYHTNLEW